MTRYRRLVLLMVTVLPVVVLLAASVIYVKRQVGILARQSNVMIAGELQRRFKKDVSVGKARVDTLGTAVIEDIRIANGKTFRAGTLASARKVTIRYDWYALLVGGKGAGGVSEVVVADPHVLLIRRADGSFNITELLKPPPGPSRPPFSGLVKITGGSGTFLDYAVRPGECPAPIQLHHVTATINAAKQPVYAFTGNARGGRGHFDRADFKGRYHSANKRIQVDVSALGVSATRLVPYIWKSNKIQVADGNINTRVHLDLVQKAGQYTVKATGTAGVRNANIRLSVLKAPATGVNGRVVLAANRATADLSGSFAGAPVRVTGTLTDLKSPILDVSIDSPSIDTGRLIASTTFLGALSQFAPSGRGPAHAKLTGALSDLTVDATARVPRVSIRGVAVQSVDVSARYHTGRVDLRSIRMVARGAAVRASGYVITRPATILALRGTFSGVDLARLPVKTEYPVNGIASGAFVITGSAANPAVSVTARAANGSVAGVPFSTVTGDVSVAATRAKVNDLSIAGVFGGAIRASGYASPSAIDLNFAADSIEIASLAKRLGKPGLAGTAFASGHITGILKSPHVEGSLEVFNGRADDYSIDHAAVTFAGDRNRITISEGVAQAFPAELRFTGEVSGLSSNRVEFAGKASVQRLEMTKLLELAKRELDVTGTMVGDFTLSGAYLPRVRAGEHHFVNVVASGNVSIGDATAFGYPVSNASGKLDYANDVLRLADASVISDGAKLTLNGSMSTDTRVVDASFALTDFELSRLQEYTGDYAVLAGTASASGTISGPADNVKATIDAKVDGLAVNYEKFDRAETHLNYSDGKFATYSAVVSRAGQSLELSGVDFDPDTDCMASTKGTLTDISVPDIFDILRASPYFQSEEGKPLLQSLDKFPKLTSGRVNGSFNLSGCLQTPEGELQMPDGNIDLVATSVGLDVQKIESIELRASAKGGVVSLDTFQAVSEDTSITAVGPKAYENGNLHLEVRAENLRLARLAPWLGPNTPDGTLSAVFNIEGAVEAPEIVGSVEVVRPGFGGFTFDRVRASSIQVTANRIEIPDILVSAGGHQVSAAASVPWDWVSLSVPKDEPISLSANLGKQTLNILSVFAPLIDVSKTTGTVDEAWFELGGTLLDPQLAGSVRVANGTIAVTGFTNTFTNVNASIGFSGDRIVVNSLSASSSEGGSVHVVPGGYVTVGILGVSETNLAVVADRLTVAEKNLLGLKEDVAAQIDAGLSITGPSVSPTVADAAIEGKQGGITLAHSKLVFQIVPSRGEWKGLLSLNPSFNVSLRLGQDVVISPPSLLLTVTGSGKLTGTLAQPEIKGLGLNIVSGDISLATARLRVIPGGKITVNYAPPATPDVSLDLQATASVFAINSLRQRERYQITMRVTGQAAKPQIDLSSSPPGLTREQMLAALGHVPALFTSAEAGLQSELANVLSAAATSTLFAPIENLFVQRLGFEQFSLEFSPIYPLSLYVSRHLFGDFYLAFYRQITTSLINAHDVQYQVVLSYRRGLYQASIGCDDQQTIIVQIGYANAFR